MRYPLPTDAIRASRQMPEPLKLRRLEHLILLAEELNFARAAELACLSQSAFSRSIQALEDSIGLRLVDRGQRHVQLTAAGARLLERARRLLASTNELQRELEILRRGDLGDVRVGAGPFTAVAIFPDALATLRAQHPAVSVRLDVDNWGSLLQRLRAEKLDFFVSDIREIAQGPDITITPLGTLTGSLFCRAGHPLLDKCPLELSELGKVQFASVYMPEVVRNELLAVMAPHVGGLPVVFECENGTVTRELVIRTDLVVVACREALRVELECGVLKELPVRQFIELADHTPLRTEIGLVRPSARTPAPASRLLSDLVQEVTDRKLLRAEVRTCAIPASHSMT